MEILETCHLPQPKELRLLQGTQKTARSDLPSTTTAALQKPNDETPMECSGSEATTPVECTESENDVMMMDYPEISVVQPREFFDTGWSRSNLSYDESFLTNDFGHVCDV
jgi:hypothetical protein